LKYKTTLLIGALGLLFTGCMDSHLSMAHTQLQRERYAAAIENYDAYIRTSRNGAKTTTAELERGECYYQLGMKAKTRSRWDLAARFFYLANIPKADYELDNCYYELAAQAYSEGNYSQVYDYYDKVIEYLPDSELVPEILYRRLDMALRLDHNEQQAWSLYMTLYDKFPKNDYVKRAQPLIDVFIPRFIDDAVALKDTGGFEQALERLFLFEQYPTSYKEEIYLQISNMYMNLAERNITDTEYIKAVRNFRSAIDYDPQKESAVNRRLTEVCSLFITKGDQLLTERKIDEAIRNYQESFTIIPDYNLAKAGIQRAETLRENIRKAAELVVQGHEAEQKKNYSGALELYRQAYQYDRLETTQRDIFEMTNQVMIEKDPAGFAKQIFREYRGGILLRRVQALVDKSFLTYNKQVQTTDWRYMMSVGEDKYEARYEIQTPEKSYYLVWLINLRERSVSPLNKSSEELSQ
jgi:hypothetical protein